MKSHSCIATEFKRLKAAATERGFQDVVESSCVDPVGSSNHNNANLYKWEKMWNNRHVLCFCTHHENCSEFPRGATKD